MDIKEFENTGMIKKLPVDPKKVNASLELAKRDLKVVLKK